MHVSIADEKRPPDWLEAAELHGLRRASRRCSGSLDKALGASRGRRRTCALTGCLRREWSHGALVEEPQKMVYVKARQSIELSQAAQLYEEEFAGRLRLVCIVVLDKKSTSDRAIDTQLLSGE